MPKAKGELDDSGQKDPKAFRRFLMKKVFLNPVIWVLAITDLFVYIVRFSILDWGPSMLSDMGLSQSLTGWTVAIFEVAGCLIALHVVQDAGLPTLPYNAGALADRFGGWGWIFMTMGGLSVVGTVLILSL